MILLAHMDAVAAEETIRNRGSELTPEGLRHLVLTATGDADLADKAMARRQLQEWAREGQAQQPSNRTPASPTP